MTRRARIVEFRSPDSRVELASQRWASTARQIQAAQDRLAAEQRRRDEFLEVAAEVAARVAAMSPAELDRRAMELGIVKLDGAPVSARARFAALRGLIAVLDPSLPEGV